MVICLILLHHCLRFFMSPYKKIQINKSTNQIFNIISTFHNDYLNIILMKYILKLPVILIIWSVMYRAYLSKKAHKTGWEIWNQDNY